MNFVVGYMKWKIETKQRRSIEYINESCRLLCVMVRHDRSSRIDSIQSCDVYVFVIDRIRNSIKNGNDPYAGSPTNTLLRLLLPLNDQV